MGDEVTCTDLQRVISHWKGPFMEELHILTAPIMAFALQLISHMHLLFMWFFICSKNEKQKNKHIFGNWRIVTNVLLNSNPSPIKTSNGNEYVLIVSVLQFLIENLTSSNFYFSSSSFSDSITASNYMERKNRNWPYKIKTLMLCK